MKLVIGVFAGRCPYCSSATRHLGANKGYALKTKYFTSKHYTLLVQQIVGLARRMLLLSPLGL